MGHDWERGHARNGAAIENGRRNVIVPDAPDKQTSGGSSLVFVRCRSGDLARKRKQEAKSALKTQREDVWAL